MRFFVVKSSFTITAPQCSYSAAINCALTLVASIDHNELSLLASLPAVLHHLPGTDAGHSTTGRRGGTMREQYRRCTGPFGLVSALMVSLVLNSCTMSDNNNATPTITPVRTNTTAPTATAVGGATQTPTNIQTNT